MVTSIAIPNATLKINTVEGLMGMPVQPMIPAVSNNGITFGIREQISIRKDLNKYSIHNAINRNAHIILSRKPLMINLDPSRKVTLVPVNFTVYAEVSK